MAPDAPDDVIRKAYRKLAQEWHPDRHPDDREKAEFHFKEIALAYEILSDPQSRQLYDLTLTLDLTGEAEPAEAEIDDGEELDFGDPLQPPPLSDPGDPVWSPYEQPVAARKPKKLKDRLKETEPEEQKWEGCSLCASVPAVPASLYGVYPKQIFKEPTVATGPFCRDCGLNQFRELTNSSLLFGWLSPLPVVSNLQGIFGNIRARRKLMALVPPARPESAEGSFPKPLAPGRTVFLRSTMLLVYLGLLVGLWVQSGRGLPLPGRSGSQQATTSGGEDVDSDAVPDLAAILATEIVETSDVEETADTDDSEDSTATAGSTKKTATPRDREDQLLVIEDHPIAVLSYAGQPALSWVLNRIGAMPETQTAEHHPETVWEDMGLATDQAAHIVIWLKNQHLSTTWFLPVTDRAGLDELLARSGEVQDDVPYVKLKTEKGTLYVEDLRTHVRISDEPQYLRFPEDTCTQLQNNLQDRARVTLEFWPGRVKPGIAQEAASTLLAVKEQFLSVGLPIEGISTLSNFLLLERTKGMVRSQNLEYIRLRAFPTSRGLRVEADGRLPKDHELNEKTHRILAPAPTSLIAVPPEGYSFFTLDRHIRDFVYIDPYLRPIAKWLVGKSRTLRREVELGLHDWFTTIDDFTISGAFFGAKRHAVQLNAMISGQYMETRGLDLWHYVRARLLSKLGSYLNTTIPRRTNSWAEVHDVLAMSARYGYLRGDRVVDPPLNGLVFRLGDAGFKREANKNVKAFRAGFGQFLGLVSGNTGSRFVLSAGSEAKSATWLSARSTRAKHPEIDRMLSLAPRNILLMFWADFEKVTKALGPLQETLCNLNPGHCRLIAELGLMDSVGIILGHDRNTLHLVADLPTDAYSLWKALNELQMTKILPRQKHMESALKTLLTPRKRDHQASRTKRRTPSAKGADSASACLALGSFVCEVCGADSPACKRYSGRNTGISGADCTSQLTTFQKISQFADTRVFCQR